MSTPKRSPLAAKVLEIDDGPYPTGRHVPFREVRQDDWAELVRLASAVELVDAEEAACNRALVEALQGLVDACPDFGDMHLGDCSQTCVAACPVLKAHEALAAVK